MIPVTFLLSAKNGDLLSAGLIKVEQEEAHVLQRPRSAEFEKGVKEQNSSFDGEIDFLV